MSAAEAKTHQITFKANPVQHRFITSRADADLFAARMGEGKSAALCWASMHHVQHNPGATHAFIRDSWENLRDTTQKEFFTWFPPGVCGEYKASAKTFTWKIGEIRGEVSWIGMDDPKDAAKLQSRSLGGFFMDEPAPAAEAGGIDEMIFDTAMTRLRQPGMNWYAAKLAENNPDETHWTYRKFVDPGTPGYKAWQTVEPENTTNLPDGYYDKIARSLAHRKDLVARFVDGKYGFQRIGSSVTPEWSDDIHLAAALEPDPVAPVYMLWDFGLTPVCIITQIDSMGHWNILEAHAVEEMGMYGLIQNIVKPVINSIYVRNPLYHIGDPAGDHRSQADERQTPVRVIRRELGGKWRPGPSTIESRVSPLRWALSQIVGGSGMIRVDRTNAREVWHALRGGWHFNVARTGVVSTTPKKTHPASDIGDAMGYGAAILFPNAGTRGRISKIQRRAPSHFGGLGFERPGRVNKEQEELIPNAGEREAAQDFWR